MSFKQIRKFFESWGLYPSEEEVDEDLSEDVIRNGINARCYNKLCEEAERTEGPAFRRACSHLIDAIDDSFYLAAETWDELEEAWNEWQKRGP